MGSSPSAPAPMEDPAIAEEKARRAAIAISMADRRETAKYGTTSLVLNALGPSARRPTDDLPLSDISQTAASKKEALAKAEDPKIDAAKRTELEARGETDEGREVISKIAVRGVNRAEAKKQAIIDSVTKADTISRQRLIKENSVADYINRQRKRTGVQVSRGVTT